MVVYFGMSDVPNLNYYDSTGQDWDSPSLIEETAKLIDEDTEVQKIINEQYRQNHEYYPRIRKDIVNLRRYYWIVR